MSAPPTVLVTDHVFGDLDTERAALAQVGAELSLAPDAEEQTLVDLASRAAAMLVCFAPVGKAVVEAASWGGCEVIARYGIGVDNIDVDTASREGILVTNVPDYCLDEVADHAMALLLSAARGIVDSVDNVRSGDWTVLQGRVHRLAGRRLALLGVGRIGRRVAARAAAFGYDVVGYDPYVTDWSALGIRPAASVADAVAEADAISLHMPLMEETHHLVDDGLLAQTRRAPILVNTSRGGLVDLDAVVSALDDGRLSVAALDVTDPEPLPGNHPLRRHPRALVTPHASFYSVEAQQELQQRAVEEVIRALTGQPPRCPVNAHVLQ